MPVTTADPLVPLSRWSYQRAISEVRVLTNQLNAAKVDDANIRTHMNLALSHIVEGLNQSTEPFYGTEWKATAELTSAPTPHIDLSDNTVGFVPYQAMSDIRAIAPYKELPDVRKPASPTDRVWDYATQVDFRTVLKLNFTDTAYGVGEFPATSGNVQWQQNVSWALHGYKLHLHEGEEIRELIDGYYLFVTRNPIMDDYSSGFLSNNVDLPDKYMKLFVMMATKMVLEQMGQALSPQIAQEYAQEMQTFRQNIIEDIQVAQPEDKR